MQVYFTSLGCLLTFNFLLCLPSDFEKFLEGQPGIVTGLLFCLFFLIAIIGLLSMHKKNSQSSADPLSPTAASAQVEPRFLALIPSSESAAAPRMNVVAQGQLTLHGFSLFGIFGSPVLLASMAL